MKLFATLIRISVYGAALAMLVGLCGTTCVWLTSSKVRTDEYTHPYILKGKVSTLFNPFYFTDAQNATYWMFDSILKYGVVVCLCIAAFIWVLQKINNRKFGGSP